MSIKKLILSLVLFCTTISLFAQIDSLSKINNDSLNALNDSILLSNKFTFSLLDSLKNEQILSSIFNPTIKLSGLTNTISLTENLTQRDLPFLKQIKPIVFTNNTWKIWFVLGIILYIAMVRLSNSRNFEIATSLVFDLLFLTTIKSFKDSKFSWTSFHLFIIYILSFSLILTQFFEYNQIFNNFQYQHLIWIISAIIAVIYFVKFFIYVVVGYLLNDMAASIKMIINTIQISNFLSFVLLLFSIFYIYISSLQLTQTIFFAMVAIFFTATCYRIIRYLLNQISNSTLPFFYLFIYLCALEISPWLIFIKILNSYLS